ncbi:MAG: sugar porter family MFS transporter [Akkermansiaceae bacterium]|jgi:MFS transporter, SP family, arabinose:H+ symporter|nr:sugar porter family MFS transporter [Akkermansiaceae bacterium]MDP4646599.1 sugar porter family MFS transporter [Akkermansiaceae bacterium]MDP4720202.1 sugar porter family MFS transporter [Akkermansiaceae bacterium]MDP4779808.1 sugar porter family MFS transporter [Akkermansiaceae bacterium]MDP4846404.1 sugar porter family MFS transporter [Akkermansiaceae bacterium]
MNKSSILLRSSITAALGGLLFGFDTVVISGAEKTIQSLWGLSDGIHGLAISMALWGTVLGALIGGIPTEKFGRKNTLIGIGILYFVSAIWSGLAFSPYDFMVARFLGGMGIGISTVVSPLYISEIAPPERRGRLTGLYQFNIVAGILIAFLSNYLIGKFMLSDSAWRWMLGVEAIPALFYILASLSVPESPRWLLARNKRPEAAEILRRLEPEMSVEDTEQRITEITSADTESKTGLQIPFLSKPLLKPISLAFFIAFFNQLSGINAILYFAPRIFEMTGLGTKAALLQSIGIGFTNLIFTFVGLWLIDRIGRKKLLIIGSFGYIISLGLCAWAFKTENFGIVPLTIFFFIASHAVGQGAVIWVFISEIFPDRHRAAGQSLGTSTHWVLAALITLAFPIAVGAFAPELIFGFFAFMMILQLIWVVTLVPETKGIPLEKVFKNLGTSKP